MEKKVQKRRTKRRACGEIGVEDKIQEESEVVEAEEPYEDSKTTSRQGGVGCGVQNKRAEVMKQLIRCRMK